MTEINKMKMKESAYVQTLMGCLKDKLSQSNKNN